VGNFAVSFFDRNRKDLAQRGIDPKRLPPGQYFTDRFPVLHVGEVPEYGDLKDWSLAVGGACANQFQLSWAQVLDRPPLEITTDIHCVTKWSKFDTNWKGASLADVIEEAQPNADVTHVMFHCEFGYTTNLPLADAMRSVNMLAYEFEGKPLDGEHGFPLRTLVPHLYLWKSAKWIRGIELMTADKAGFWERNGYHMYGDPFREQRHWGD
jgi:DMSO/TMAO reductase YedYZ molybdopterin-dependent catalytic subunit